MSQLPKPVLPGRIPDIPPQLYQLQNTHQEILTMRAYIHPHMSKSNKEDEHNFTSRLRNIYFNREITQLLNSMSDEKIIRRELLILLHDKFSHCFMRDMTNLIAETEHGEYTQEYGN